VFLGGGNPLLLMPRKKPTFSTRRRGNVIIVRVLPSGEKGKRKGLKGVLSGLLTCGGKKVGALSSAKKREREGTDTSLEKERGRKPQTHPEFEIQWGRTVLYCGNPMEKSTAGREKKKREPGFMERDRGFYG